MMSQPDTVTFTWDIGYSNWIPSWKTFVETLYDCKRTKFWLDLYPKDVLKNMKNHVANYLLRAIPQRSTNQKVLWTIAFINNKGEECYRQAIETNFVNDYYAIEGALYHLHRDTIQNPSSGLLPGGKLTLKCTISALDDQNSVNIIDDPQQITLAKEKALENYQSILESCKFSDVVVLIGQKEFKLHKAILSAQSPVFAAMFNSDLEEAKQNRVEITDVDVEVFEAMVRFIYTGNVDSVQLYALDLFVAAHKYQLDSLKDICARFLGSNLSIESVANILLVADMHSEAELKSKCVQYINANSNEVFVTEGWKHLVANRHQLVLELYYDVTKFGKK